MNSELIQTARNVNDSKSDWVVNKILMLSEGQGSFRGFGK